jgi:hypothetical protein
MGGERSSAGQILSDDWRVNLRLMCDLDFGRMSLQFEPAPWE